MKAQAGDLKEDARAKILEQLEKLEASLRNDVGGLDSVDEQSPENA